jgi:MFS family permease
MATASYSCRRVLFISDMIAVVYILQARCFFGALVVYYIADRWGRKPALLIASGVAILAIIIQVAAGGYISALYVGRIISGFGVGAASMLTPLSVSENSPRATRGRLTGLYQLFITTGTMLSFWVNYGTQLNLTGNHVWQIPLTLQCLPAMYVLPVYCGN